MYVFKIRTFSFPITELLDWENLTLTQFYYLEYSPYSNFTNYPNNVFHDNFLPSERSKLGSCISFTYQVSLVSQSGTVLCSFFTFVINSFEELSYKIPMTILWGNYCYLILPMRNKSWFVWSFIIVRLRL